MIRVIEWAVVVFLWIVSAAFAGSDLLCVMALFHNWKDREFLAIFIVVAIVFAIFGAAAAYGALMIGRCL